MNKEVLKETLRIVLNEINKDLSDPSVQDLDTYQTTMLEEINRAIDKARTCKHKETEKQLKVVGLVGSGKKKVRYLVSCNTCNRTWFVN
jgi:hypothetical protein